MIKKFFTTFVFLLFLGTQAFSYGVLAHPRKVYVLSTNHFDILFPEDDKGLAKYLADNADSFYDKANFELKTDADFRIPIVLSPDSDVLSIEYTSYPYYRMVIFDAVPDAEFADYKTTFDNLFYHEVFSAVAQSMMSPFNKTVKKIIGGDPYNPVSLINLPFSFVEGFVFANNPDLEMNKFNDKHYLQILAQTKLENKFPTWFQTFATRDIYPGDEISIAAGSAFSAYLINTFGIEKYAEFWEECGKLHPYITVGNFYKVYKISLNKVWKNFEDSIPLPADLAKLTELENEIERLFKNSESNYEYLVSSKYGLIWYDSVRHEVDICELKEKGKRKRLFYANNIQRLELSSDEKYLAISFFETKSSENFKKQKVWIYNLEDRDLFKEDLFISDATFLTLDDGSLGIAGICKKDNHEFIQIYKLDFENDDYFTLISEEKFSDGVLVSSLLSNENGKLLFLYFNDNSNYLCEYDYIEKTLKYYQIENDSKEINIQNLKTQKLYGNKIITFEYTSEDDCYFNNFGYITLDLQKSFLQCNEVSGGINYPAFANDRLYFSSKKIEHDELECISLEKLCFNEAEISKVMPEFANEEKQSIFLSDASTLNTDNLTFGEYDIKKYSPIKYLIHLSAVPFMTLKDISTDESPSLFPGLGFTLKTQADPFMNNQVVFSASWKNLNFDYTWYSNAPIEREKDIELENLIERKDKSIVCYFENTSTPIDIKGGAIFRCNLDGEYDLKTIFGTNWQIPLGMSFVKLNFNVNGYYSASTDYYDSNLIEKYQSLSGWPGLFDVYDLFYASTTVSFTNIHQYGISKFQNLGVTFGVRLYSLWDLYENELLEKAKESKSSETELTNAQKQTLNGNYSLNITQLNLGFFATLALPKVIPVNMFNGWVVSLPTTFNFEFMPKSGTVLSFNTESLLIGKEFNQGIPFLYLFFNRFGLKGGYSLNVNYDTKEVTRPDIRNENYLQELFSNVFLRSCIYLQLDMDTTIPIGALSDKIINSQFKVNYFPDTQGFTFSLLFDVKF